MRLAWDLGKRDLVISLVTDVKFKVTCTYQAIKRDGLGVVGRGGGVGRTELGDGQGKFEDG